MYLFVLISLLTGFVKVKQLLSLTISRSCFVPFFTHKVNVPFSLALTDFLPDSRRRLPLEEQLQILQARYDEVMSGKHSIGQSRRAKALKKEMTVLKRKLAHQREGICGLGGHESGLSLERGSVLAHHASGGARHDEGESSSHEISGKGQKMPQIALNQPQIALRRVLTRRDA